MLDRDKDRTLETFTSCGQPRKRTTYAGATSLALHLAGVGAALALSLALAEPPPEPVQDAVRTFFFSYDPPPPPPPPLPLGPGLASRPAPRSSTSVAPQPTRALVEPDAPVVVEAPAQEIAGANEAGGDPQGSVLGDPEGMEGGVVGGVVGGVPGGVIGGVIGGTGTGPVPLPVPVAHPDRPPRVVHITRPVYPQDAFVKKVEGTVVLEILIDEHGRVVRTRVRQSVPMLDAAAIEAVGSWIFVPAFHAGRPVATVAVAPVSFRIF